jgi:hypothetical protein
VLHSARLGSCFGPRHSSASVPLMLQRGSSSAASCFGLSASKPRDGEFGRAFEPQPGGRADGLYAIAASCGDVRRPPLTSALGVMKSILILVIASMLWGCAAAPIVSKESADGELNCNSTSNGVEHELHLTVHQEKITAISYSSRTLEGGASCNLDATEDESSNTAGAPDWQRWNQVTLVRMMDESAQRTEFRQIAVIVRTVDGYRVLMNPATFYTRCSAPRGRIASALQLTRGNAKCSVEE